MQIAPTILITLLSTFLAKAVPLEKRDDRHVKIIIPADTKFRFEKVELDGSNETVELDGPKDYTFDFPPDTDPSHTSTDFQNKEFRLVSYVPGYDFKIVDLTRRCTITVSQALAQGDTREWDIQWNGQISQKDDKVDNLVTVTCALL